MIQQRTSIMTICRAAARRLCSVLLLIALSVISVSSWSDVLTIRKDAPDTYVVKKGDTLWDISQIYLDSPWLWPELWSFNPQIDNPHLIYPGDILKLVYIDGKPRLVSADYKAPTTAGRDVKLRPGVRISDLAEAIPAIPLDAISPFISRTRVVNRNELEDAPYVLAGREGKLMAGAGSQIYARGDFNDNPVYGVYRQNDVFIDPITGEFLGIQALDIGTVKQLDIENDIATMAVNRSTQEMLRGDRLLEPLDRRIQSVFQPKPPIQPIDALIIGVERGVSQIGRFDAVIINRGAREQMQAGDVLLAHRTGEVVQDVVTKELIRVPDTQAGVMMVFRVFEKVSYALVLQSKLPLKLGDKATSP